MTGTFGKHVDTAVNQTNATYDSFDRNAAPVDVENEFEE